MRNGPNFKIFKTVEEEKSTQKCIGKAKSNVAQHFRRPLFMDLKVVHYLIILIIAAKKVKLPSNGYLYTSRKLGRKYVE